ncbi:MAG: nodulation protein NfeD [Tissierellales bacterium]|nr:nodulation protein NfeD [Tissierellales bacterium]
MKKRFGLIFVTLLLFLAILPIYSLASQEIGSRNTVYVIPIKGEINNATANFVKEEVNKINNKGAAAIIFEIDTYGGLIDSAINIKDTIVSTNIPTISFVNNKAISAGVLITISSEHVVMSETSVIGSAETIPNTEKALSMWRSVLRDTAQLRGIDPIIIESMADSDIEIENVIEKGKLLSLTAREALDLEVAQLISSNYDEMLEYFNIDYSNIEIVEEDLQIRFAKAISNPTVSTLLLTLGFVGLVLEIFTPGFGVGAAISLIGFGLYFGGNILAGNSSWTAIILFVVGLILLGIEALAPGFGLPGISGIIIIVVGIVLAMGNVEYAVMSLSISIIIATALGVILVRKGYNSKLFNKIVLNNELDTQKGYISSEDRSYLNEKTGKTITDHRPSGFSLIDNKKYDTISDEGFLPKDSEIIVVRVEGSKIFIRRK